MNLNFKLKKNHIELLKDIEEEIKGMKEKKNKFKLMLEFHKKINDKIIKKYNNKINIWDIDNIINFNEENNKEIKERIENIKQIIEKKNKIIIYEII